MRNIAKKTPLDVLPDSMRENIMEELFEDEKIFEIRIRVKRRVFVITDKREFEICCFVKEDTICEILEYATCHSLYAYEEAVRNGYITMEGGHRIGMAGQVVIENNTVKTIKNISSLNIRFANEITGVADELLKYVIDDGKICNTLIVSPPGYGKTTVLRDLVRITSGKKINNHNLNVAVIDERSEIAASYNGVPQNDVGMNTDVLDGCPKAEGMIMVIRALAPDILVIDELGLENDVLSLKYALNCGCHVFATIHGESIEGAMRRPVVKDIFEDRLFDVYIVLGEKKGVVEGIYNADLIRIG